MFIQGNLKHKERNQKESEKNRLSGDSRHIFNLVRNMICLCQLGKPMYVIAN
jgi:hypothetical protein